MKKYAKVKVARTVTQETYVIVAYDEQQEYPYFTIGKALGSVQPDTIFFGVKPTSNNKIEYLDVDLNASWHDPDNDPIEVGEFRSLEALYG